MKGSLRELSPDRWEMRLSLGKDPATGKIRKVSRTFHGTEADAVRAMALLHEDQTVAVPYDRVTRALLIEIRALRAEVAELAASNARLATALNGGHRD